MIKFFILFIFTNFIKAQYDDLLIDYQGGINSDPLLSEKNKISQYDDLLIDYERGTDPLLC